MSPRTRLYLACSLFSSWMILLLTGAGPGGLTHLLLAGALAAFPWRLLRAEPGGSEAPADTPGLSHGATDRRPEARRPPRAEP